MNQAMTLALRHLLRDQTVAALGTLHESEPSVSMVPFALLPKAAGFVIHVSDLASHTGDMRAHGGVSLLVVAPESAGVPPQARARITVRGSAKEAPRSSPEHENARSAYLARFPETEGLFNLADFSLFCVEPSSVRFVAGFAQAATLNPESFASALREA